MIGTKTISDLITDPSVFKPGRSNIIEAPVSSGKTFFALTALPEWAGSSEKVLYLIDTTQGELHIQRNIITKAVDRATYSFFDYNTGHVWGEQREHGMPVMTYAGFGSEVLKGKSAFRLNGYKYIICDEMQHLVSYQSIKKKGESTSPYLIAAENALRDIASSTNTKIVALSATPEKIREHFSNIYYDVPYDQTDVFSLETFHSVPYSCSAQEMLSAISIKAREQTGILYTTAVEDMKDIIAYARQLGIAAEGFWSSNPHTQAIHPFTAEQTFLRDVVLEKETIPANINLLVINAASETCIKIDGKKRKVDYMIIHNCSEEIKTQVRGRYHGDLEYFYYHDKADANQETVRNFIVTERFLNVRLYKAEQDELCALLTLRKPHGTKNDYYKWPTVMRLLRENGYDVRGGFKDSKRNGQRYYLICGVPN